MGSRTLLLFCIFWALVLTITSLVAARDLAETSTSVDNSNTDETNGVEEGKYGGGGYGGYRGGYGGYLGGGHGGYGGGRGGYGGGRGGYGGGCRYGCCGRSYYGGCRCCSYPGQALDAEPQN